MFVYWTGYEVDGSSTSYNIVIPKRELVSEIITYFLNLKIIDHDAKITFSYSAKSGSSKKTVRKEKSYQFEEIAKIYPILTEPDTLDFRIWVNCVHPDKLFPQVRKELFDLSKTRPGAEDIIYQYQKPTISPFYYVSSLGIEIYASLSHEGKRVENYEPEGLVLNRQILINNMLNQHLTIDLECGPSFIYEYAAYIVTKVVERFPEVGIDGGIDCAGGFTEGCTYSCSLYGYERIKLTNGKIAEAIRYLIHEKVFELKSRTGKYGWKFQTCSNLALFHLDTIDNWAYGVDEPKAKIIKGILGGKTSFTPEEYEEYVKKVSVVELFDSVDFMNYCTCAVEINGEISALTCIKENEQIWLELRVVSKIRDELEKKLRILGYQC